MAVSWDNASYNLAASLRRASVESYDSPYHPAHQQIRSADQPFTRVEVGAAKRVVIATIRQERPAWGAQQVQHIIAHALHFHQTTLTRDEVLSVLNS